MHAHTHKHSYTHTYTHKLSHTYTNTHKRKHTDSEEREGRVIGAAGTDDRGEIRSVRGACCENKMMIKK